MDETLNINLTNDRYPVLEVSLVQAVGPKGNDGGWFNLKGDWSLGIAYVPYDLVNTTTGSYICVAANIDSEPTVNNPDWMRLIHTVTDESKIDKTSIKQELGTSTTDLLSQNIITTNINRIYDELLNKIDISQLSDYYTKSQTYNKSEIHHIIGESTGEFPGGSTGGFNTVIVDDIVEMTDKNTIYLTFKDIPGKNNKYNKYIVFEGVPELLTDISKSDLSNFITLNDLNKYVSDVDLNNLIRDYYNKNSVYNKTEIDNLLANLNLEIDTSGFATIELLGEYIPFSKIKQSTGSSDSDLMSQKAITDLINSILNGLQDDLRDRPTKPQLDNYLRDTLLGKPDDLREPNVILNDLINGGSPGGWTRDELDDYLRDTLLGKPDDLREPNVILNDLINGGSPGNPGGFTRDELDDYLRDTLLGRPDDLGNLNDILNDILDGLRGDLENDINTRPTQADIGGIVNDFLRDNPTIGGILDDINDLQGDVNTRPTQPEIDNHLRDTMLGGGTGGLGDILDGKINGKIIDKLGADDLDSYVKVTLLGVGVNDDRSPNVILDNKINSGSPGGSTEGLTFEELDAYIKNTLLGATEGNTDTPKDILDDRINGKIIAKLGADDLDAYIKGTLLGVEGDDGRDPNKILNDVLDNKINSGLPSELDTDKLDKYLRDTLLGAEGNNSTPNEILESKFAEKLDTDGLNTALSTTSTITTINNSLSKKLNTTDLDTSLSTTSTIASINTSLSKKVDSTGLTASINASLNPVIVDFNNALDKKVNAVSGSRLITSAEITTLENAVQPGALSEYAKVNFLEAEERTDDLVHDKCFIRVFDELLNKENKVSTLSLKNSLSVIYPTAKKLESTGDKFDGETYSFPFNHNFIEDSAKLNKNGLIYYKGHGFNIDIETGDIILDVAPTSEDIIFIEAVYLD